MQDTVQILLVVGADVAKKLADLAGREIGPGELLTTVIRQLDVEQREAADPGPAVIELHALIEVQVAQRKDAVGTYASNVTTQQDEEK